MLYEIGLDFHGVIDLFPFLAELSQLLVSNRHEVHVITGEQDSQELRDKLEKMGIKYTHLFSIVTHHIKQGTPVTFDKNGHPWMNENVWNKTKAWYCFINNIDLHLDDSDNYQKFFKTPYARVYGGK